MAVARPMLPLPPVTSTDFMRSVHLFQCGRESVHVGDGCRGDAFRDAAGQSGQDFAAAELDEAVHARLAEPLNGFRPADRARNLFLQALGDAFPLVRAGGHVAEDGEVPGRERRFREQGSEPVRCRLHERAVERCRHLQGDDAAAEFLQRVSGRGDRLFLPGDDGLGGRVQVGGFHRARYRGERFRDLFRAEFHDCRHRSAARFDGFLHQLTAPADEPQGSFDLQGAAGAQGRELAQAVTRGVGRRGGTSFLPGGPGGQAGSHERGLLVGGQLQFSCRSFEHEVEQARQDSFGAFQHFAGCGAAVVEIAGHADRLGALPGEHGCVRAAHAPPQVRTQAAQVSPAPKETRSRSSPSSMRPSSSALRSASGMEAVELFPYSSTVTTTRSISSPSFWRAASMMRRFAWWGTNRLMSAGSRPAFSTASRVDVSMTRTANLNTSRPFMYSESASSVPSGRRVPMLRWCRWRAPLPSAPVTIDFRPYRSGTASTTAAPAPSPNRTAVERSSQSTIFVSASAPITSTFSCLPASTRPAATSRPYSQPGQAARRSNAAAFRPNASCTSAAVDGNSASGVLVATMTMLTPSSASRPWRSTRSCTLLTARSEVYSSSAAMWRRRMPVRVTIHSSVVSIIFSRSSFVRICSGA